MSRVATMGTSSCATIAVSGFKDTDVALNKAYNQDPSSFKRKGRTVKSFYDNVLYPVEQNLGKSGEYPFDLLMQEIDDGDLSTKFIIATLNAYQYEKGYWPPILEKHGFSLIDKTKNEIGSLNYIYTRNRNRRD